MKLVIKLVDRIMLAVGRAVLMCIDPTVSRRYAKMMDLDEVNAAINALK